MKLLGVFVGVFLMLGALVPASTALAASASRNPPTTAVQGDSPHLMLTKQLYSKQPQSARVALGGIHYQVLGEGNLFWHGGPVETSPRVFLIFWGPTWGTPSAIFTEDPIENYFQNVGHTAFFNNNTQYFGSNGSPINVLTYGGAAIDTGTPTLFSSCTSGSTVYDSEIQTEVASAISAIGWPTDPNSTYLVYTDPAWSVDSENGSGICSNVVFCGYHFNTTDAGPDLPYAVLPYPNLSICPDLSGSSSPAKSLVNTSSHEDSEAITDPFGTGWYDSARFEVADKCAYNTTFGQTVINGGGNSYWIQTEYNNQDAQCQNWYIPETVGVFAPASDTWYLRNENSGGNPDITPFTYGGAGDIPVVGDWTGYLRYDSIGVYRPSNQTWYLRNTNGPGSPDITFQYGAPGDIPVVGNWCSNVNGADGIGVFRPSNQTWYLRCTASGGAPDITFQYGGAGDIPVVGNWGSETAGDTVGVYRPSSQTWYLTACACASNPSFVFQFGNRGDVPVAGDFTSAGIPFFPADTVGVFGPSSANFYLNNALGPTFDGYQFQYGGANWIPLIGQWVLVGASNLPSAAPTKGGSGHPTAHGTV